MYLLACLFIVTSDKFIHSFVRLFGLIFTHAELKDRCLNQFVAVNLKCNTGTRKCFAMRRYNILRQRCISSGLDWTARPFLRKAPTSSWMRPFTWRLWLLDCKKNLTFLNKTEQCLPLASLKSEFKVSCGKRGAQTYIGDLGAEPQRGSGTEPLVRGSEMRSPLKLKAFFAFAHPRC